MTVDYYSLLTKAVAGKDAVARNKVYREAHRLIAKSHLTSEAASSHVVALEDAIRQIENDIAAEEMREQNSAAAINKVLLTGRNWKPLIIGACAVVAVIALSALLYGYLATRGPGMASVAASSPKAQRGREDVIVADLKSGLMAALRAKVFRLRCSGKWCFTGPPSFPVRSWSIGKTAFSI